MLNFAGFPLLADLEIPHRRKGTRSSRQDRQDHPAQVYRPQGQKCAHVRHIRARRPWRCLAFHIYFFCRFKSLYYTRGKPFALKDRSFSRSRRRYVIPKKPKALKSHSVPNTYKQLAQTQLLKYIRLIHDIERPAVPRASCYRTSQWNRRHINIHVIIFQFLSFVLFPFSMNII